MNNGEYRAFLDMLMRNDPWCVDDDGENMASLEDYADSVAREYGHEDWIDAYHNLHIT